MSIPSIHRELSLFSCDTQFSVRPPASDLPSSVSTDTTQLDITVTHEHFPSKLMSPSKITVADHQPAFNDTPPCGEIWAASRTRKSSESARAAALARRRSLVLSRITANVLPPPVPDADQSIVRTPLVRLSISVHQGEREGNRRSQNPGATPETVDVHIGQDASSGNCDMLEHEPSHSTDTFWDPFSSGLIPDTRFPTSHVRTANVDHESLTYSPRLLSPALIHSAPPDMTTHSSPIPATLLRERSVASSPLMHTTEALTDSPLTCISSLKSESDLHDTFEDDLPTHASYDSQDETTPSCTPTPPPKDKRKGASLPKRKGKRKGHCSDSVQSAVRHLPRSEVDNIYIINAHYSEHQSDPARPRATTGVSIGIVSPSSAIAKTATDIGMGTSPTVGRAPSVAGAFNGETH